VVIATVLIALGAVGGVIGRNLSGRPGHPTAAAGRTSAPAATSSASATEPESGAGPTSEAGVDPSPTDGGPCASIRPSPGEKGTVFDFGSGGAGWEKSDDHGSATFVDGALQVLPRAGLAEWIPAPSGHPAATVTITADACLMAGQGGWGVWCRGTAPGQRRGQYEFSVSHAGVASIKDAEGKAVAEKNLADFDIYSPNMMTADCRDAGGTVQLTMKMNGVTILSGSATANGGRLLGPGLVGLHAFAFGDTAGETADARFGYFEVTRG
jgi:hypothetical protein